MIQLSGGASSLLRPVTASSARPAAAPSTRPAAAFASNQPPTIPAPAPSAISDVDCAFMRFPRDFLKSHRSTGSCTGRQGRPARARRNGDSALRDRAEVHGLEVGLLGVERGVAADGDQHPAADDAGQFTVLVDEALAVDPDDLA